MKELESDLTDFDKIWCIKLIPWHRVLLGKVISLLIDMMHMHNLVQFIIVNSHFLLALPCKLKRLKESCGLELLTDPLIFYSNTPQR
jgi:hypothetical protein